MTVDQALKLAATLASAYQVGSQIIAGARTAMTETDQAKLDEGLAKIATENDADYLRIDAKLAAAEATP